MAEQLRVLLIQEQGADTRRLEEALATGGWDLVLERVGTADTLETALGASRWDLVLYNDGQLRLGCADSHRIVTSQDRDLAFVLICDRTGEEAAVAAMRVGVDDYVFREHLARLPEIARRGLAEARTNRAHGEALDLARHTERRLTELAHKVNAVMWTLTGDPLETEYASPAYPRVFDMPPDAAAPSPAQVADRLHPEDRAAFWRSLHAARAGETSASELRLIRRDGSVRWLSASHSPMRRDGDHLEGVVGVLHDITEQRSLREQLMVAQRMEAVGRLTGGIAHDLNNILMVIGTYAAFILEGLEPAHPLREDVDVVAEAAARGAGLIRQLLAFSRTQSRSVLPLSLNELLARLEPMLRRILGEDITLSVVSSPSEPVVDADVSQLEQVLMNLVVNARDAMPDGGTLTLEADVAVVHPEDDHGPTGLAPGDYGCIVVSDTGIGMDEDVQARIFEPFFTTKGLANGTGLGLSTAHGLIRQHRGSLAVSSQVGHGTRFEVRLPLSAASPDQPEGPADGFEAAPESGVGRSVLIVEDEGPVGRAVRRILDEAGYETTLFASASEALAWAAGHAGAIDLLLTDVIMPNMRGTELARLLTADRPRTRVIFMSGYTDREVLGAHLPEGGTGGEPRLLLKPFTASALLTAVRATLDHLG